MLCIIGKTAAGKDAIQKELIKLGYDAVVSYTTRPMRHKEVEGVNYFYIDNEKFLKLKNEGFFAETTEYHVATGETWYYGSAKNDLTDNKIMVINPDGLRQLKKDKDLNIKTFYVIADEDVIRKRLSNRGDNQEEYERRIKADNVDFENIQGLCDLEVSNNTDNYYDVKLLAKEIDKAYKFLIGA